MITTTPNLDQLEYWVSKSKDYPETDRQTLLEMLQAKAREFKSLIPPDVQGAFDAPVESIDRHWGRVRALKDLLPPDVQKRVEEPSRPLTRC